MVQREQVAVQLNIQEMLLVLNERTEQVNLLRKYNEDLINDMEAVRNRNADLIGENVDRYRRIKELEKEVEELNKKNTGTSLEDLVANKIGFIKWVRSKDELMGLKEAKEFVEMFWEAYALWIIKPFKFGSVEKGFVDFFQLYTDHYHSYYLVEDAFVVAVQQKSFARQYSGK